VVVQYLLDCICYSVPLKTVRHSDLMRHSPQSDSLQPESFKFPTLNHGKCTLTVTLAIYVIFRYLMEELKARSCWSLLEDDCISLVPKMNF